MPTLIAGLALFLGIHSTRIVAPELRARLIARVGEGTWKGVYALVALLGLFLIVRGYGQARLDPTILYIPPTALRHLALALMLPAFVLLAATYLPGRIRNATKHPMLAATKLWALAHLMANGMLADVLLFGGFLAWAVAARVSAKRHPRPAPPAAPASAANDLIAVVAGVALYAVFLLFAHEWLFGVSPLR